MGYIQGAQVEPLESDLLIDVMIQVYMASVMPSGIIGVHDVGRRFDRGTTKVHLSQKEGALERVVGGPRRT